MISSPAGPVPWSLQHPQAGIPDEGDAVALSFRLESELSMLMHNGIKLPALEEGSHPFPIHGRRSGHSESLPAHADLRAGAHVANEVRAH